jgi:acyl carrier protein
MTNIEIEEKVIKTIAKSLGISVDKITLDKEFIKDLGADSLDVVEIVISLEEAFKVLVDENDAEEITNVRSAVDYITKLLNK